VVWVDDEVRCSGASSLQAIISQITQNCGQDERIPRCALNRRKAVDNLNQAGTISWCGISILLQPRCDDAQPHVHRKDPPKSRKYVPVVTGNPIGCPSKPFLCAKNQEASEEH